MEENKTAEEIKASIEEVDGMEKECTEMTEIKRGTEKPKYDDRMSMQSESRMAATTASTNVKEFDKNTTTMNRKDAETIVVNVITEKSKGTVSVTIKEEQV